ncbi:ribosomal RNA small subunit methyltransferase D [Clostridia bacterium]|nr:ribosomal RNA small subunit methyltransferase D [Clostridia bacterium]
MRIIGGEYRGRKVAWPNDSGVRPTPDRIRENIFNILRERIPGARVLDLFAGSGLLGLEFLSRGAACVTFSDKSSDRVRGIRKALADFKTPPEKFRVIHGDCFYVLRLLREEKFDIIYIDPPYREGLYDPVLKEVFSNGMLAEGGLAVAEHSAECPVTVPTGAAAADERVYGTVGLTFFEREAEK